MTDKCQTPANCPFDAVQWGKMIEKLDNIHAAVLATKLKVEAQNGRIGKLEKWQWKMAGGLGLLVFLIPILLKAMGAI